MRTVSMGVFVLIAHLLPPLSARTGCSGVARIAPIARWKLGCSMRGALDGPKLSWMADGMGGGYASVSVAGNRIYTTGNFSDSQSAVAIDATTGKVIWTQPITQGCAEARLRRQPDDANDRRRSPVHGQQRWSNRLLESRGRIRSLEPRLQRLGRQDDERLGFQ